MALRHCDGDIVSSLMHHHHDDIDDDDLVAPWDGGTKCSPDARTECASLDVEIADIPSRVITVEWNFIADVLHEPWWREGGTLAAEPNHWQGTVRDFFFFERRASVFCG